MFPSQSFVRVTAIALLFVLNFSHAEDLESCELNCSVPFQCECDDLDTNCICIFPGNGSAWGVTKNPNNGNKGFNKDMNASLSGSETSTTSVTSATSTTTATSSSSSVRRKDLTSPRSNTTSISTDYGVIVLFTIPPSSNCHLSSVADFIDAVVNGITTPFVSASGICQDDVISTVEITVSFNTKEIAKEAYTQLAKRSTFAVKGEEYKPKMTAVGFEPNDDKNKKDDTNSETVIIIVVVLVVLFAIFGGVYMMNGVKSMPVVGASTPLVVTNIQIRITTGDMYQDYNLDSVLLRKPSNGRDSWIIWTPSGVVKPTRLQFVIHFDEYSAPNLTCSQDDFEFTLHKVIPRNRKNLLCDNLEDALCKVKWASMNQSPNIVDFPPTARVIFSSAKARSESHISDFKEKVHRIRIKMKPQLSSPNVYEFDVFAGKKKIDFFNLKPSPNSARKETSASHGMQNYNRVSAESLSAIQPPVFLSSAHQTSPQQQQFVAFQQQGMVSKINPLFSLAEPQHQQFHHNNHQQQSDFYLPQGQEQRNFVSMPEHDFNTAHTTSVPSPSSVSSLSEHVDSPFHQALSPYNDSSAPINPSVSILSSPIISNPDSPMTYASPPPSSVGSPLQNDASPELLGSSPYEYNPDSSDNYLMLNTQSQASDDDVMELINPVEGPEIIDEIFTLMENEMPSDDTPEVTQQGTKRRPSQTSQNSDNFLEWLSSDANLTHLAT
eukprot:m.226986 g.226986  ORF g.226986 m.226986 type:complete len:721 (+) comp15969_c2_seq2:853-3015(+)